MKRPAILCGLLLLASPALGQTSLPGHRKLAPDSSGPQTAIPAPRPGGDADTPGGSAKNGVIEPPATGTGRSVMTPRPGAGGSMPVIPPPGTAANQPSVQPK